MRTSTSLVAAAVVAGGLVVTAPATPSLAVTETNNILVTNQYAGSTCGSTNHQIQIANAFTGALVQDLNSPVSSWQIPNDAKPFDLNRKVVALWGGHSSTSGTAGIGVYDRTTNSWTTTIGLTNVERGGNGPHSITVLPDGYFAVAQTGQYNGSGSGWILVISPSGTVTDSEQLSSAHGVEWDGSRTALFAVGYNDVRKYTYSTITHTLTQAASYDIPGTDPGGHDLRRRRTDNDYMVTVNAQGYVFDPETGGFSALLKSSGSNVGSGVKNVDQRFDGITEYSYYQDNRFHFFDRGAVTAQFCLSGYKQGRWLYAAGEQVFSEDTPGGTPPPPSAGIGFGFPMDHVASVQAAGADLEYGSFWVGHWVNSSGWGGLRSWLDKAIANNVTPVIQWYYWGDEISDTCYQSTCGSSKTKSNWDTLAGQLRNEIAAKMQGRRTIVVLETEWHKNGMSNESTFDGWLRNQMNILRSDTTEDIEVALGWGHWADSTSLTTYTQAGQYADLNSTMILFSCVQETRAKYTGAVDEVISDATELKNRFAKPVIVSDFGLSTYSGSSSGDPEYSSYGAPKECEDPDNYETLQEAEYAEVFTDKTALATAGVNAWVFRAYNDDWDRDAHDDFHKIAERWFGIVRDTATDPIRYKASYDDVINGIKNESGGTPPDPGPPPTGSEWAQEAEAFTSKPVGGSCTSSTASGGACWNVWSNGTISTAMTVATAGVKRITVRALGDPAGGVWPIMKVRVGTTEIMNLAVGSDQWADYGAAITLAAGSHTLAVEYTNDGSVDGNDRNLLVDVARLDPATRSWYTEAESFQTKTAGIAVTSGGASGGAYWNLWSNGYIETPMDVPYTSQHQIHVSARGDVAGGVWPQMKVYVDGTLVLTQTVNVTSWTTYAIRRTLTGGTHTIRIEFTNDAIVGTEDRNLKIDRSSLYT